MKLRKIAFRNVLRNKRRSILSGVAIAIAAMMITVLLSLYAGIGKDMKDNVFSYFTGHIRIRHNDYDENEEMIPLQFGIDKYNTIIARTENIDTVRAVTPRIQFGTALYGSPWLYIDDIKDWNKFLSLLKSGNDPVFSFLKEKYLYAKERLSQTRIEIPSLNTVNASTGKTQLGDLLYGLNKVLERYILYDPDRASGISLSEETMEYTQKDVPFEEQILFNRLFLENAFPDLIMKNPRAGKMIIGMGLGMDFEKDTEFINLERQIQSGRLPEIGKEAKEMLITSGLARKLNATIGDRITLSTKTKYQGINGMTLKVTGIVDLPIAMFNSRGFYLPIDTAQKLLKMEDTVTDILVLLVNENRIKKTVPRINEIILKTGFLFPIDTSYQNDLNNEKITDNLRDVFNNNSHPLPDNPDKISVSIEKPGKEWLISMKDTFLRYKIRKEENMLHIYNANVEARPWTTIEMYPAYITLIDFVGYYMGLFFFLLGSTVIITTTMMVIYERMREIGTIAAMGMTGGQIVKLFFLESFFIGAIASFVGVLLGSGIAIPMSIFGLDWTESFETIDFAMSGLMKSDWNIGMAVGIFIYSTAVASFASFIPSRKAAKIQPVEALRAV
jgi:ABC-type lipoprotein release transport system permease subunit